MPSPTENYSGKYLEGSGRTSLEGALKRLDKLTHEEARMATAQVLKVTHAVDESIQRVDDRVRVVGLNGTQIVFTC